MTKTHERLVDSRRHFVHDPLGDSGRMVDNPHFRNLQVGAEISMSVAAPGYGSITYRITRVDTDGAWGIVVKNTVRIMTAAEAR